MKKIILLVAMLPFFALSAVEPTLTTKDLSTSPAITETIINYGVGTRKMVSNTTFAPTGDYTVEVKAKLLSAAVKGLLLETRNSARTGFRMAINATGVQNLGALNYSNESSPVSVNSDVNDAAMYHTFRFAVEGTNVHIYRDGIYVTSTTTEGIYNDNLLKDNNGNFETEDMSMWYFLPALTGQGRTITTGEFRNGSGAVKLKNNNNSAIVSTFTIKNLKPSTAYSFSFYAKYLVKSTNTGNMRYDFKLGNYDGTGAFVRTNASDPYNNIYGTPTNSMDAGLATWTPNGKTFTTGPTDSVAVLDIIGWNGNNTYVIDDMVLFEMEATPTTGATIGSNLVTNGEFTTDANGWSAGNWPLGAAVWSATNGGQLQIKEANWVTRSAGTYNSAPITVSPNKIYKLSAKTSQRIAAASPLFQSIKLADGFASVSTNYSVPTGILTSYYTNTTPAITTGPTSTSLTMQFTTTTNSSVAAGVVVMTLDDVVLQEYEAAFPTYLSYGKAYQSEALNVDIAYINYDLTGAFAPYNGTTSLSNSNTKLTISVVSGKLIVKGVKAGDKVEVFNSLGMKILTALSKDCDNQFELKAKGVLVVKVNNELNKIIL